MRERVLGYIDGFNLFRGVEKAGWKRYHWLDVPLLIENLLKPGQTLCGVNYFTARLSGAGLNQSNQAAFLEALETQGRCSIHLGRYQEVTTTPCSRCGFRARISKEKMTDVNIASQITADAFENLFDSAILVSGDADLTSAVRAVVGRAKKRVVVAFPPERDRSKFLKQFCSAYLTIGRAKLAASQLPDSIEKPDGTILRRPAAWS